MVKNVALKIESSTRGMNEAIVRHDKIRSLLILYSVQPRRYSESRLPSSRGILTNRIRRARSLNQNQSYCMQRLLASRPISFSPILRRPFTRNRLKPPPRLFLRTMATPSQDIQWQHVQTKGPTPSYNVFPKPVRKSENDDREYRIIRLENGLEAMVIQDATADKAAASLDVAVGHLHDPVSASDP